ncbi:flagellar filament capping protein FliD [Effusibacillus pohliae]|uniref:flagellar filament capping protein FliD n=1 Tax=Effusibacillus pohliae TaxID=232270 RepID=UPI00035E9296|nr:flagellar filament capping protein FliD [Effusibacillus pohliae]
MGITGLGGLGGLVSGLDSKALINQLMQIESQPLIRMKQQQHLLELKKGLYGEINSSLLALQSKLQALTDPAVIQKKKVTSSDATVATATVTNQATVTPGTYSITITQLATALTGRSADQTAKITNPTTGALGYSGTFNIVVDGVQSQTITINASDNLNAIANRINSALDNTASPQLMKIKATVVNNTLFLSTSETGSGHSVKIINDVSNIFGAGNLGLVDAGGNLIPDSTNPDAVGKDAQFTVNGVAITRKSNTNLTDVINGVSLNLLKGTSATPGTATLTIDADLDASVQAVKDFVNQYNSTLDLIQTRLTEKPIPNATSDVGMSKGLLRADSALIQIQSAMRSITGATYTGSTIYKTLYSIGIQVDEGGDYGKSGHLMVDESKLRDALTKNPTEVMKIFFNDTNGNGRLDPADTGSAAGFAATLYNKILLLTDTSTVNYGTTSAPNGLLPSRIDLLTKQMSDYDMRIDAFNRHLDMTQKMLERQFSALEVMLQQNSSQGAFLQSRLG